MLAIYQASKTSCFLIGNGFIFFNAAKQILHLHNGLLYLQTNRVDEYYDDVYEDVETTSLPLVSERSCSPYGQFVTISEVGELSQCVTHDR